MATIEHNLIPATAPPSYDSIMNPPAQNPHFQCENSPIQGAQLDNEHLLDRNEIPEKTVYLRLKKISIVLALVLLMVISGLTTFYVSIAYGRLKQYGQACNPSVPMSCGTTGLSCLNSGVCGCKDSDYRWNQQQGLCEALVDTNAECRTWGWDGTYAIPCSVNAVCNEQHRCECIHYFVAVQHDCIATFDGICDSTKDCNQLEFLFCGKSGKCECRPGTVRHRRDNSLGCYVKIGETCSGPMHDRCVDPNSNCTSEQICRCNKDNGYIPSRDNTSCGKIVNSTCHDDDDCADTLSCVKLVTTDQVGNCYCRDTETLNETNQQCLIKAGNRCDVNSLKHCVKNAICQHSTCECARGYGLDETSGLCLGTHGTVCESNVDCLGSHFFQCNGGQCRCDKNHTQYSEATGSCFGERTDTACFDDLNCDRQKMNCNRITETCTCRSGFEEFNKSCYGAHGAICTTTDDCVRQQMLTCLEGRCGCDTVTEWWEETECKLRFNRPCGVPGMRSDMKCVGNLTCLIDPNHTNDAIKVCGCESKYIVSQDERMCINRASSVQCNILAIVLMIFSIKLICGECSL